MNLTLKNITKSYSGATILDNLSIDIKGVKTIGIIGESGCGKSTLLRLLSGIEAPDRGEISFEDMSPQTNKVQFQQKIGVVFQKHNLFPHLTLKQNITMILHNIKKLDKQTASKKADALLEKFFIQNEANKKPAQVSGGQAQRGSIARALATDPKLIFLDEPTASLDPLLTEEVLSAVKILKDEGKDFIFITHEVSFLKQFAEYVIFLKDGKICECGDHSILTNPQTKELKQFLKLN